MPATETIRNIQNLIWLYFWLLIVEGVLRKWVTPQLSTPLLIIRDPVVIAAYFLALKAGIFPKDMFTKSILYISFISFLGSLATVIISDTSLTVTIYGLRTNFLHLPLIFLIPKVFCLNDVKKLGRWVLLLSVPMAVLMIYQFNAPPDAFINRGASAESQQISSALGKIRPSGTFSFITGAAQYFSLLTSFLLYGLVQSKIYPNWLLSAAGLSLVLALAVSGSRTAIWSVVLVLMSLLAVLLIRPSLAKKSYKFMLLAGIISLSLSLVPSFNEGIEVLTTRFENANASEAAGGGIVGRFFSGFLEPFNNVNNIPLLGYGLGMGTNVGAALLTERAQFIEGEWERVVFESGLFLGLLYILLRIALLGLMGVLCIKSASTSNILPLLLFGSCLILILIGQFGQPTSLGFAVLEGGLCLASLQFESYKQALPATYENFTNR